MLEHKQYECEFCGAEFDHDEHDRALKHESECDYNPTFRRCASCAFAKIVRHYEEDYIQCTMLRSLRGTCGSGRWLTKKES